MATCSSLHRFFENPLPENSTLLESLAPWNQIKSIKPVEQHSFTEIFGELHFKEKLQLNSPSLPPFKEKPGLDSPSLSLPPPSSPVDRNPQPKIEIVSGNKNRSLDSVLGPRRNQYASCSKNSERVQLCTEGLGSESSDEVEDSMKEIGQNRVNSDVKEKPRIMKQSPENLNESKRLKSGRGFPPPISCIGRSGKPWVCFRSYRHDGRFVLREIRIPTQELLHACRKDGRLKLHYVQHDEEISQEQEESDEQRKEEDADEQIKEEQEDADGDEIAEISLTGARRIR
eukprot:TRINITY_DN2909_c0_g3_i1.p1 TRINITY_DN2909_c0_g3~~TRINITY_DN2909_c0_g3_i1.p1  ORF type:complete len:286 (-),score=53.57 TRINITY_DN2909_c0_g3_i1:158-1015(-)